MTAGTWVRAGSVCGDQHTDVGGAWPVPGGLFHRSRCPISLRPLLTLQLPPFSVTEWISVLYCRNVAIDVWVGAATTLVGAVLGGAIGFVLNRQQARDARQQRQEEEVRELRRRSADRRFQAYSEFLTRARSFRNAVEGYYVHPRHKPSVAEIDSLLQSANDASALVFLVVESEDTYRGCRSVLRALWRARAIIHGIESSAAKDPWDELNVLLGSATREFQNAARNELGVSGPAEPWDSAVRPDREN